MPIEPNSFDDFEARFDALCESAKSYGLVVVYGMVDIDNLGKVDKFAAAHYGSFHAAYGAAHRLVDSLRLKDELR